MIVIINSGPLMALGKLGLLDLLSRLYGTVEFPTAVFNEVVVRGRERGYFDAFLVQMAIQQGKLRVIEVNDIDLPPDIATLSLDAGEKQVLKGDMGSNLQNSFDSPQAPTAHTFTFSGAVCGAGIAKFLDNLRVCC